MAASLSELEPSVVENELLDLVRGLLREKGKDGVAGSVTLGSSFVSEMGLAGIDLVELMVRCEDRFEIRLPDNLVEAAECPAGWVKTILEGGLEPAEKAGYQIPSPRLDGLGEPVAAKTLVDALVQHAEADPGRVHIHLLEGNAGQGITYGQLYDEASAVAAGLAERGLRRNETVAILLPTSPDFFPAFFGVLLAGGIPVPASLPTRPDRIEDYVQRQIVVLRKAAIRFLIASPLLKPIVEILRVNLPNLLDVATVDILRDTRTRLGIGSVTPPETAVLQFTSGSTGNPKAVALSHAGILNNVRGIGAAVDIRPGDAVVSWLPLYSDLGLVGCWLLSLYYAIPFTVFSPLEFLQQPERWLRAIHDSRGTLSAGPNFAYELCARRIPAWTLAGIDLSCWRVAVNAGEPVLAETVDRFSERFKDYGLSPETMLPCYGLAESTVALTMPPIGRLPRRDRIRREEFEVYGKAVTARAGDAAALTFFSAGQPIPGQEIRLVDELGREVPERTVGRLLFRGATTMVGYYRDPEATAAVALDDGWIDSGDYGYLAGGEFHFTGRSRDSIEKAGRTMNPLDVEAALSSVVGVLPGSAVAFGAPDRDSGAEQLVVAAETAAVSHEDFRRIEAEIIRVVDRYLGMPPDRIQLVEPGCLPRTSNGKIQRNELRSRYIAGRLRLRRRPPWQQLARLWLRNLGPLLRRGVQARAEAAGDAVRGGLAALVAGLAGTWVRMTGDRAAVQAASRRILKLRGYRVSVQGAEQLNGDRPAVLVANRYAALDPLVAAASLPGPVWFADLAAFTGLPGSAAWLLRPLLIGYGTGQTKPVAGALRNRIRTQLEEKCVVVVFPEGPVGAPVLRSRFRLDALQAAMEMGAGVYPTAIRERSQPRPLGKPGEPRKVSMLIVREPVDAAGAAGAAALRDQVRAAIGEYHA